MASVGESGESLSLNIMPMLDIFSILILFLLMSFSSDPVQHDVDAAIELPDSLTVEPLDEVPTVVVSKSEIKVQDKKVASIISGDVSKADIVQGSVYPVFQELEKLAEANKRLLKDKKDKTSRITLEMDKDHDFKLMKRVLLAAQQAEFIGFKLMVAKMTN